MLKNLSLAKMKVMDVCNNCATAQSIPKYSLPLSITYVLLSQKSALLKKYIGHGLITMKLKFKTKMILSSIIPLEIENEIQELRNWSSRVECGPGIE